MKLIHGDCLEEMPKLEENSVDTIITDPPYGLDFMGKDWDHGVPGVAFWEAALRVAKPGAMLFAFGGTRTVHRLTCAIEDAGWIIRDRMSWLYGSGFPKSHNISKAIDKAAGVEFIEKPADGVGFMNAEGAGGYNVTKNQLKRKGETTPAAELWDGYGTALKPAHEPIILAMKPLEGTFAENALKWGVAGLWIDGGRVGIDEDLPEYTVGKHQGNGAGLNPYFTRDNQKERFEAGENPRYNKQGRWPANILHDGSDEVLMGFPVDKAGKMVRNITNGARPFNNNGEETGYKTAEIIADPGGSAARFFYCAKASKDERNFGLEGMIQKRKAAAEFRPNHMEKAENGESGNPYGRWEKIQNFHPTVKPLALMRYLCRLSRTPFGGVVLDPFAGSFTTGVAAVMEGRDFIGMDMDADYIEIGKKRIAAAQPALF